MIQAPNRRWAIPLALGSAAFLPPPLVAQGSPEPYEETVPVRSEREALELSPVDVQGERVESPRYQAPDATTATKTDTPIIETPQSVSVISAEQLRDLGALTLQDAFRYSAGVRADAYGLDSRTDSAIVRGTEYVQYQDGLRSLFGFYNNVRTDVYALDSVEVVRGPSSVLYGQGTSGGMVNVNSKRPQTEAAHELRAEYGDYQRRQYAVDFTGPVTSDASLSYRIVGLHRNAATQVDYVQDNREFIAPSLTWRPSGWFEWTVLGNVQKDRSGSSTAFLPWEGTIQNNPNGQIPTHRFVSEPGFDRYNTDQEAVTSLLKIALGAHWTLSQNARYMESESDYHTMFPNIYTGDPYLLNPFRRDSVLRITYIQDARVRAITSDHRLGGEFSTGFVDHQLLLGVDATKVTTRERQGQLGALQIVQQGLFDLYDPEYGDFILPEAAALPELVTRQTGYYIQNQMTFGEHLIALAGWRRDEARSEQAGSPVQEDEEDSLRAGLLYRFDAGFSPYVSYSESFNPVAQLDADGNPFQPIRGEQWEAGLKYQPPSFPALITATVFEINEENRLAPGENPAEQVQLGTAEIKGAELEAGVTWPGVLDLLLAYTYLDAFSDAGDNADEGARIKPLAAVADEVAALWMRFHFGSLGLPGLSIGAGLRYTSAVPDEGETVEVPSTTLFDAMIAYEQRNWRLAVNGTNLEDETVIATCLERGDCFYGPRRNVVGSLTIHF